MEKVAPPHQETFLIPQLAKDLLDEVADRGLSIALAEGCSGGALAADLTIPGATRAVHLGGIFYSTESKISLLGVPRTIIAQCGVYSPETAIAMVLAIQKKRGDDFAIATVGDIDPGDRSKEKIAYIAYSLRGKNPWVERVILRARQRMSIKSELTVQCFSDALLYIRGAHDLNRTRGKQLASPFSTKRERLYPLSTRLVAIAREKGLRIGTIESSTGGAIANALTDVQGASDVFDTGWLAYDENVKVMLGVPLDTLAHGNVYSEKVALAMVEALYNHSNVDIAISSTGLMDTIDTRPFHNDTRPGTTYAGIHVKGLKPMTAKLELPCGLGQTREDMKIEATRRIFNMVLDALSQYTVHQDKWFIIT